MRILPINPSSSCVVSALMDRSVERLHAAETHCIDCMTLNEGSPNIGTQTDIASVVAPLCRVIAAESDRTNARVTGCFADPAHYSARETAGKSVLGICEAEIATAPNMGGRLGVMSPASPSRKVELRVIRPYGYFQRFVSLEPINVPVVAMPTAGVMADWAKAVGARLKRWGAGARVLGGAGMARYENALRARLGLPVVDPSAVAMAMGIVALQ